jgi:hypothetical protein
MSGQHRHFKTLLAAFFMCGAVSGCQHVVETVAVSPAPLGFAPTCHSALGAYYLPRRLLSLHATAGATDIALTGLELPPLMIADRRQPFCLDHLSQVNSRDIIAVDRDERGLLTAVSSDVEDRTPDIAKKLIATGENLAIASLRSAALQAAADKDELHIEFDPFNWEELTLAKKALRRFGYCVYLEGESFEAHSNDARSLLEAGSNWCSRERVSPSRHVQDRFSALPVPPDAAVTGILYRPNISYKVVVLRRSDPERGPWKIYQTKRIDMPNIAPVMAVGVERAMFAKRETALKFEQGVLTDVAVKKGSELEGFVEIPLAVAHAIVDVPAQIVQVRIADNTNQAVLLNAQLQLMDTLSKLPNGVPVDRSARLRSARAGGANTMEARNGSFLGACTDAGQTDANCRALLQGAR